MISQTPMAAAGELKSDDRDSRFHQEIIESLGKVEALLKVLVESQVNTQLHLSRIVNNTSITTTAVNYKNDEDKHKAAPNPSSSSLESHHQPALASTSSTLLTLQKEDTLATTAATNDLAASIERPSTVNGNQEITHDHNDWIDESAEDGGPVTMGKHVLDGYDDLYDAAIKGDWEKASEFLKQNPEAITEVITYDSQTVLHIATYGGSLMFIKNIVNLMPLEILEYRTGAYCYTALHCAAMYGFAKAAEVMVKKNPKLTQIGCCTKEVPLCFAITSVTAGQRETVEYLYSVTKHEDPSPFTGTRGDYLLHCTIQAGFYDIASSLVRRFPELVIDNTKKVQTSVLNCMAERPYAFASGAKLTFLQHRIYSMVKVDIHTAYEFDTQTNEERSEESLPQRSEESLLQSLGGTNGDEENPFLRDEGSCRNENYPPENSRTPEGLGNAKPFKWETVGLTVAVTIVEFFFVFLLFLVRFIWSPVPRIKQLHKQLYKKLYNDKVKHKQAEALVRDILTQIKERMSKREVDDLFSGSNVMNMAIRHGSVEFVYVCIQLFPHLIWTKMGGQFMIQIAIAERNKTILNLICKLTGEVKSNLVSRYDNMGNTILHHAAMLAPSAQLNLVSGAYLQMQRELQWFKGVENMISEQLKFKRNIFGHTAHDIFTKEHKELKESGEKWLKDTSGSCMVVAALIAIVAFSSAFTVPGGNISDSNSSKNGTPVFFENNSFMVFVVADALALFSSITSVLMFLALYTSPYAEVDFLKSLPQKMITGLATLFISMASVLVAFGASLFVMLEERFTWAIIPIVVFGCIPVTLFAWLQLPLLFHMVRSTYWGSLFREHTFISSLQLNSKKED